MNSKMNNDMKNSWIGTSFYGDIINCTYDELVERLGEPTNSYGYNGDDEKVQQEWMLVTDDNVLFTIYDWKEYDRDVTDGDKVDWHIGRYNNDGDTESIITWLIERGIIK